jgi:hypothetical protein
MVVSRAAFEQAGRFPPFRAAEDLIFMERLFALPLRIAYASRAVVHWQLAPDVGRTFRRFALYSEHNLRAGRGRFWHLGILRHYVLMALVVATLAAAGAGAWALSPLPSGRSPGRAGAPGRSAPPSISARSTPGTSWARRRFFA